MEEVLRNKKSAWTFKLSKIKARERAVLEMKFRFFSYLSEGKFTDNDVTSESNMMPFAMTGSHPDAE